VVQRRRLIRLLGAHRGSEVLLDAALALLAFGATLGLWAHGGFDASSGASTRQVDALAVALAVCTAVPLLFWRRSPVGAFVVSTSASAVLMLLGYAGVPPVGATIALYLIAASRDEAHPWNRRMTETVVGLGLVHVAAFGIGHGKLPEVQLAFAALVWAVAWFAGERTRLRRQQLADLEGRATRAEQDAERDRRLAVAEERARIARDLHDSAAHSINVIAVQAGAARLLQRQNPARSEQALRTIEQVARQTVEDIDQIVHSLREDGAAAQSVEPAPGLASLGTLLAQHAAAGLPVEVATHGTPHPLGAAVDQAAYRIVQEALTNCARHGNGPARILVDFNDRGLDLMITNPVIANGERPANGGHGLVGMRERATLLGGELQAERVAGEFRVQAAIPYGASA
jgi:signal transduction histidine kinase